MISVAELDNEAQNIIHFGGVRIRVVGNGNLKLTFQSLDSAMNQSLVAIPIPSGGGIEPLRLANFNTQRAFLRIETTQLNEIFKINRVVVFAKPIYTSYPA